MTPDADLELRVARLENDHDAIDELIDHFRSETRTRFDQVDRPDSRIAEVLRRLPEPT